ncbi:MAG TPA: hypothetical protein VE569_01090 [Acidimicrobiia bacterium]|nr:hypothetical protein [Acidimicrobiia bacterium]
MDTQQAQTGAQVREQSKGKRITFRVVSIMAGLFFVAWAIFGLTEVVLMWLPAETLASITGDPSSWFDLHRAHGMAIGIAAWSVVLPALAQWHKPKERVGSMLLLLVHGVAALVIFAFSGGLVESLTEEGVFVVPIVLLAVFHPRARDLLTWPNFDRYMAIGAAAAAVPWAVYVVSNSAQQLANVTGDSHTEAEHWALAAVVGVIMMAAAFIGSSHKDGWRLPAWIAVGGSFLFGLHSLVFPGLASGLSGFWAVAAMIWAVVFAVLIVRRSREGALKVAG